MLRSIQRVLAVLVLAIAVLQPMQAFAVDPDEVLKDPALEERAREISSKLRCLVCQNQSIDSSDAPLAKDLRVLVRERLVAGDSNSEVLDFVVERYGEFALLQPRIAFHTVLLWGTPFLALLLGIGYFLMKSRSRRPEVANASLSTDEQEQITKILEDRD